MAGAPADRLPDESRSYWMDSSPETAYAALDEDIQVDVAVVGAGIAGISTAALLKEHGCTVALIDANRTASRVTGHTTAKLTALHGSIYNYLLKTVGAQQAQLYADANQAAIDHVRETVDGRGIDCDLTTAPAYTYTNEGRRDIVQTEADAAQQLGLPATYVDTVPAPVDVAAAVRLDDQAYFHPRKYLLPLADSIPGDGSQVFEETRIRSLDRGPPHVLDAQDGTVTADHVVITTHFPFRDTGAYFARMYPRFSYVIAAELEQKPPDGMYYGIGGDGFDSFRPHATADDMLLVGGQPHRPGDTDSSLARYRDVARFATAHFPVEQIPYRWATQDYTTVDRIPYIGRLSPFTDTVYVATGFGGWGMTHGVVAGMLLTDLIRGQGSPWQELYTPNRVGGLQAWKTLLAENLENSRYFVGGRLGGAEASFTSLGRGEGAVMEIDGKKTAVYRDGDGELHARSAICTHMRCVVSWNDAERTWDCSCHGSRFDYDGSVIDGPAQEDLPEREISDDE